MGAFTNKIDFEVVIMVNHGNPNGDPLNGNRPREDFDGFGEISDVCLKRKIRNRLQDLGEKIFVQSEDRCDDGCKSLADRTKTNDKMQKALETSYATSYMGFLGVDMMVCRQKEGHPYAINPHVEINLRMNMGIVSHVLSDHFIVPGGEGRFSIDCFPTHEALMERHEQDMQSYPLVVKDGRVVSGYLPLVPVTPKSRYRAFVCVTAAE